MTQEPFGPLAGLRIIDLTVALAGSQATMLLADLGAEIIKVESTRHYSEPTRGPREFPPGGDVSITRSYPDLDPSADPWNRWSSFNAHARNKRSVVIDLTKPSGRDLFTDLVRRSDGLVENNRPGQLEKLGLDPATLQAANDRFVIVRMPAVGLTGPDRDTRGFGWHFEELAGVLQVQGYPDGPPVGSVFMDSSSGPSAASAMMMGLLQRRRTGKGQTIELAQIENLINHFGEVVLEAAMTGQVPPRRGNADLAFAPQGIYPCQGEDDWIALSVRSDDEWAALVTVLGEPDALRGDDLATAPGRRQKQAEIDEVISGWTSTRDKHEVFHLLQHAGIPAGPVLNEAEAFGNPQMQSRGYFVPLHHRSAGTHFHSGPNFKLSETPLKTWRAAPVLGEDNEYVGQDVLGLDSRAYERLVAEGHFGDRYE